MILNLLQTAQGILANGEIDGPRLDRLRRQLYADGYIDRTKADFLVALHRRIQPHTPAFERLFYQALKDHLLACERLGAEEADWLRCTLFLDGELEDEGLKFLHELKGEAKNCSPEFEVLVSLSMTMSSEHCTYG